MNYPTQPLVEREGLIRFRSNRVVSYLLDQGGIDMNHLACRFADEEFNDERAQLAQLIGYSLSGYGELGYVSNDKYEVAVKLASDRKVTEQEAILEHQATLLSMLRNNVRNMARQLFQIHHDDLRD